MWSSDGFYIYVRIHHGLMCPKPRRNPPHQDPALLGLWDLLIWTRRESEGEREMKKSEHPQLDKGRLEVLTVKWIK